MSTPPAIPESHRRLVERSIQGVLSTVRHRDGRLSANPVAYTFDGEAFRISTLKHRMKYANVLHDPRVALCIVSMRDPTRYIEIRGRVEVQDDPGSAYARHQFRVVAGLEPPADLDPPGSERVILVLHPEQISAPEVYEGRFDELVPSSGEE